MKVTMVIVGMIRKSLPNHKSIINRATPDLGFAFRCFQNHYLKDFHKDVRNFWGYSRLYGSTNSLSVKFTFKQNIC